MLRTTSGQARALRLCVLGLATVVSAIVLTTDTADARRHRRHVVRASSGYSPPFASIIVDANSGATLSQNNADALRHPASLTKIMTLYLLFERMEAGKLDLDSEMDVSQHASSQAPTKLGLRPGSTLRVEDAIKGLVTRSANDAAVVIAEAVAGDEDDFAKLMTRKARALGMTRTTYRNASGLPDEAQVTTARDQSVLGRAIQDRFPRQYRYFSTSVFNYRGHAIRNHNRLLGNVEGVDGIKTGYTRASGFNLVTSIKRGNRYLVGVVLGGRSGGSRDATMRNLLAENLDKASGRRTVAAITERSPAEANIEVAEETARTRPTHTIQVNGAVQSVPTAPEISDNLPNRAVPVVVAAPAPTPSAPRPNFFATAAASVPSRKPAEPMPLSSGVIETQQIAAVPGSSEPMKPVRVRTVQVKSAPLRIASADPSQPTVTAAIPRSEMPAQPAGHGTGRGILGVLPASSNLAAAPSQAMASVEAARVPVQATQDNGAIKPAAVHSGWIIQVGALESESEARARLDAARSSAKGLLGKADPFTEAVLSRDKKLFRARFAGLDRSQAEAICKTLKRSEISCITIRN